MMGMQPPPGPTGPPDPSAGAGAPQMSPQQAQAILGKLGIRPEMLPMVSAACEALMGAQEAEPPQQGGGLMAELSSRYQEPTG